MSYRKHLHRAYIGRANSTKPDKLTEIMYAQKKAESPSGRVHREHATLVQLDTCQSLQ